MAVTSQLATEGGQACPVCGSPVRRAADVGAFQLFACDECLCWCSDALRRAARTSFTPTHYFANDEADRDKWEGLEARLAGAGRPLRHVLDVGCGSGAYLSFLRQRHHGLQVVGIELDPERARRASESNPGARIHTGDAHAALEGVEGRFDLITLWDVFEHVSAPAQLLAALAEKLVPGGFIYMQTIHEHSVVPRLGRLLYRLSAGRLRGPLRRTHEAHHLVFFSLEGLDRAAEAAGLRTRERWFGRLARQRMDGHPLVTGATSLFLAAENALGNGLFVNLLLEKTSRDP